MPHGLAVARHVVVLHVDHVAARPARDAVGAAAHRVDLVVTAAAADRRAPAPVAAQAQQIVARPTVDGVDPEAALQTVLAGPAEDDVAARAAEDAVVAVLALEDVEAAVAAVDLALGPDEVVARPAQDVVGAVAAEHRVVAVRARLRAAGVRGEVVDA